MDDASLWAVEERLWLEGTNLYETLLDPAWLMAFPGMGIMRPPEILESLVGAPRWMSVTMTARAVSRPADDLAILGYSAEGRREGAAPYRCLCTSTYRRRGGAWTLIQHQQTPVG